MTPMPRNPGSRLSFKPAGSNEYQELGTITSFHITEGPEHTMSGNRASLVIVDDPHDYVAQSAGVLVLKSPSMGKTRVMDTVFDHVGPQRSQMGKTTAMDRVVKKHADIAAKAARKMSGIKGLR